MPTHAESVHEQFDPRAQAYLTSRVHAAGPDLDAAERLVTQFLPREATALDVGCGAGHLSFRLCPRVRRMVALDPSATMLATVSRQAATRGCANLATRQASAQALPFDAGGFDLVATRYSAHHWTGLEQALREMQRVTRRAGFLLLIDSLAPDDPLVDTHFQAIELLRDRSHVRNRSLSEWHAGLSDAGFAVIEQQQWPTRIEFGPWVERMRTPAEHVVALRSLQATAPVEVQRALAFEPDGSFVLQTGLFWARRVD